MKTKIFILFLILGATISNISAQYDNFGQMWGIENSILGKSKVRGDAGYVFSIISYKPKDDTLYNFQRNAINLNFDINFYKHLHARTSFYIDLSTSPVKPPFLSDLFYQLGWYDWHNKSFSFGYENYQPNNIFRKEGDRKTDWAENFRRGMLFASFNYDLLQKNSALKYDKTSQIRVVPAIRYFYEYSDKYGIVKGGNHKIVLTTAARWTIIKNIYVEGAVYYYPDKNSKLPWDADFTYGFGMFDWRAFKMNFSYGNWIANRFPWNEKQMTYYGFLNGEFKATFTWAL